jgi:hypothetical protein
MNTNIGKYLMLSIIILTISCGQNGNESSSFSFTIHVTDANNNPIEGVEVFVNNKLSSDYKNEIRSSTLIKFDLVQDCNLQLTIYNLNNRLVNSLIDEEYEYGSYAYNYSSNYYDSGEPILGGCNILKCNILATEIETGQILYDETMFMCRYTFCDEIGITDSNGEFFTDNNLYFPHLYEVPEMQRKDESNNVIGTFSLTDLIEIEIYDPISETSQMFERVVEEGNNSFELIWNTESSESNTNSINTVNNRDVDIIAFTTSCENYNEGVSVAWTTENEMDIVGYNILRSLGSLVQALLINTDGLIAASNNPQPTNYNFIDFEIEELATYNYWLESVDIVGEIELFGPISITTPEDESYIIPSEWYIEHCPNPFN